MGWCEFNGTGEDCAHVVEFLGGPSAGNARWKLTTYDGGWIIRPDGTEQEFNPGDTILRHADGSFSVGAGKAWAARLDNLLSVPEPSEGADR